MKPKQLKKIKYMNDRFNTYYHFLYNDNKIIKTWNGQSLRIYNNGTYSLNVRNFKNGQHNGIDIFINS